MAKSENNPQKLQAEIEKRIKKADKWRKLGFAQLILAQPFNAVAVFTPGGLGFFSGEAVTAAVYAPFKMMEAHHNRRAVKAYEKLNGLTEEQKKAKDLADKLNVAAWAVGVSAIAAVGFVAAHTFGVGAAVVGIPTAVFVGDGISATKIIENHQYRQILAEERQEIHSRRRPLFERAKSAVSEFGRADK